MSRFQGLYVFAGVKTFSSVTCMINKLFKDETVGFFFIEISGLCAISFISCEALCTDSCSTVHIVRQKTFIFCSKKL